MKTSALVLTLVECDSSSSRVDVFRVLHEACSYRSQHEFHSFQRLCWAEEQRERERETGAARMSREEGQPLPLAPEQSTETQRERALNY